MGVLAVVAGTLAATSVEACRDVLNDGGRHGGGG
jgi:hypothetical protein